MTRPSPTESATLYKIGTKKKGNDGNVWQVTETRTGTHRWVRLTPKEKEFLIGPEIKPYFNKLDKFEQGLLKFMLVNLIKLKTIAPDTIMCAINNMKKYNAHDLAVYYVREFKKENKNFIRIIFDLGRDKNTNRPIIKNKKFYVVFMLSSAKKLHDFCELMKKYMFLTPTSIDIKSNFLSIIFTK